MYTYTLFLPHLWTPSSAINADPAPGAEVVIFFCQRARPRCDSPRGWTFEDANKQNRWQLEWVLDVGCTKCDRNACKDRTSHCLTKWITCTLQEPIATSNTALSTKNPKDIGEFGSTRQYRHHRTSSQRVVIKPAVQPSNRRDATKCQQMANQATLWDHRATITPQIQQTFKCLVLVLLSW